MRYEFNFEAQPFDAYSEFEDKEQWDNDFEMKMIGGISERDYIRWVQFSLNMYFKKTGFHRALIEDGKDTIDFRNAVEFFNSTATGRQKHSKIDEKTQDALIKANEHNSGYLYWLRTQLNKLGYAPLTVAYKSNEKPTSAIKAFQKIYDGSFGLSLRQDGFVGAKTHLALLHAIKQLKPKPTSKGKPRPVAETAKRRKKLALRLLKITPSIEFSDPDPLRKQRVICIIRKITSDIVDGVKFDDSFVTLNPPLGAASFRIRFSQELIERYLESDDGALIMGINTLYEKLLAPLLLLNRRLQNLLIELTSDPLRGVTRKEILRETEECKAAFRYLAHARDPKSIYSCLATWILATFKECDFST